MKKLLLSLSAITLVATPISTMCANIEMNKKLFNNRDIIDANYTVPSDIQQNYLILQSVGYEDLDEYSDVNTLKHLLDKSVIMFQDIYDEEFFYKYMDILNVVIIKYSDILEEDNSLKQYKDKINELTLQEEARFTSSQFNQALKKYQYYKHLEYLKYVQNYHEKNLTISNQLTQAYYDRNKDTDYLKQMMSYSSSDTNILKTLSDMNNILTDQQNKIRAAENIFKNSQSTYGTYKDSTQWFADRPGYAFIPFYGPVYFVQFANHLKKFTDCLQEVFDLFAPDENGKTYMDYLNDSLKEQNDKLGINIDNVKDIDSLKKVVNDANVVMPIINAIFGIVVGAAVAFVGAGPIGAAVGAILTYLAMWITAISESFVLSDKFYEILDKYDGQISSSYKDVISSLSNADTNIANSIKSNNEMISVYDHLYSIVNESIEYIQNDLDRLNKRIDVLEADMSELNDSFSLSLAKSMQSGYEYYALLDDMGRNESEKVSLNKVTKYSDDYNDYTFSQIHQLKINSLDELKKLYIQLNIGKDQASIDFFNNLVDNDNIINDAILK